MNDRILFETDDEMSKQHKSDFWFDLPHELIAQTPIERREQSRLLCLERYTGETQHRRFFELPELLRQGDCLVMNDSRVLPARLIGRRKTGGVVEVLLLRDEGNDVWECLVRPGRRIKEGEELFFGNGELTATVTDVMDSGNRLIKLNYEGIFLELLERLGKMPLPPYIHEELKDAERYQTVYSRTLGSAAAPTAGLHFTKNLLDEISARGVELCYVTLHVGLGTFRPVKTDSVEEHVMHSEYFEISLDTAETINRAKAGGGRIIAVGTTSCRALESCATLPRMFQRTEAIGQRTEKLGQVSPDPCPLTPDPCIKPYSGFTDIFIYPGYEFKIIDGLITNFHLPESTLIMLVSAFAGRENVLRAYKEAIGERYRFFSFGDAMLIS